MHLRSYLPYHFFTWCNQNTIGAWINHQTWVFAILETIHILALALLLGGILVVDLRLLGFGLRRIPVARVARALAPWIIGTLILSLVTGAFMFMSEAVRLSISTPFFFKLLLFVLALVIHFTIYRKATAEGAVDGGGFAKVAACASLLCWVGVGLAGRAIGFLP